MATVAATMSVATVHLFEGLKSTTCFSKPIPSLALRKTTGKLRLHRFLNQSDHGCVHHVDVVRWEVRPRSFS